MVRTVVPQCHGRPDPKIAQVAMTGDHFVRQAYADLTPPAEPTQLAG